MTSGKLKSCPFCGSGNVGHRVTFVHNRVWHFAKCHACGGKGPEALERHLTPASERAARGQATKRWNRRAEVKSNG